MDDERLNELHEIYLRWIPLFYKSKTYFIDKNRSDDLCNKNQAMAVMIIGKAREITPTTLSKFISLEKGSLTTLIDSLVEKELVIRSNDSKDRRKVLLSLTADGMEYQKAIQEQSQKGFASMLALLDETETEQMAESFRTLVKLFSKIAANVP